MEFVGNVGLSDVMNAYQAAKKIDANPVRLVGRIAGLGSSELDAGVPTWAWLTVAFGAGVLATAMWGGKITKKVRSVF